MLEKTTVVLIVLIFYKLLLISIGLWANRRNNNISDFLIGNRQLGPVVASISYAASCSSAWTLLGVSGIAFTIGLSAVWFVVGSIAGMILSWMYVAPKLMSLSHQNRLTTLTDILLLNVRSSFWRMWIVGFASLAIIICFGFYVAAQLQGAGQTFNETFSVDQQSSIIIGAIIILIYTLLGGFWAVSVTDTIQGILMLGAALLLPLVAYMHMGGWESFWTSYSAIVSPEQLDWFQKKTGLIALGFVVSIVSISLGAFGQPHLLVRFMALRDKKALNQAKYISVFWFTVVFTGMFFLGLAGRVIVGELSNAESVFIVLSDQLFVPIVSAIIIAALLSAIMSTADSQLLAGSAAISHDLGLAHRFKGKELLISRLAIVFILAISTTIALYLPASIFSRALLAWSSLGAAFGPIIIARVLDMKPADSAVFLAIAAGFCTSIWFHFYPNSLSALISTEAVSGVVYERVGSFFLGAAILIISHLRNNDQTEVFEKASNYKA